MIFAIYERGLNTANTDSQYLRGRNKLTKYSIYHQRDALTGMTRVDSVNLTWKGWKWIEKFSLSTQGGGWGPQARVSKVIIASPCCVCCCSSRGNRGIELAPLLRKILAPPLPLAALSPFYIFYLCILTVKLARLPLPLTRESDVKRIIILYLVDLWCRRNIEL